MRAFEHHDGSRWIAGVGERPGTDFKGRFFLVFTAEGTEERRAFPLRDVRWNSRASAARTLRTMSSPELRRRLRSALGRSRIAST